MLPSCLPSRSRLLVQNERPFFFFKKKMKRKEKEKKERKKEKKKRSKANGTCLLIPSVRSGTSGPCATIDTSELIDQ